MSKLHEETSPAEMARQYNAAMLREWRGLAQDVALHGGGIGCEMYRRCEANIALYGARLGLKVVAQ